MSTEIAIVSYTSPDSSATPAEEMGQNIKNWLEKPAPTPGPDWQLREWLQGYGLPVVEGQYEPYYWILRGLETISELNKPESRFCNLLSKFLEQKPDERSTSRRDKQVLYNALMLSACLHCPKCLAKPIHDMHDRRAVKGRWLNFDLGDALLMAMIENQVDRSYEGHWLSLMREDDAGLSAHGLDGFLKLPDTPIPELKLFDDVDIVDTVVAMDRKWADKEDRVSRLDLIFQKILKLSPSPEEWSRLFLIQAGAVQLSRAAVGHIISIDPSIKGKLRPEAESATQPLPTTTTIQHPDGSDLEIRMNVLRSERVLMNNG